MKLSRFFWQTGVILGGKCVTKFDTKSEEEKGSKKEKKRGNPNPEDLKNENEKKVQEHFLTTWVTNTLNPCVQWFGGDSNSHYVSFSPYMQHWQVGHLDCSHWQAGGWRHRGQFTVHFHCVGAEPSHHQFLPGWCAWWCHCKCWLIFLCRLCVCVLINKRSFEPFCVWI